MISKKRVLITGGAGFIGSHLADFLIGKGYDVICMDNLLTGKMENVRHLLANRRFKFAKYSTVLTSTFKNPAKLSLSKISSVI